MAKGKSTEAGARRKGPLPRVFRDREAIARDVVGGAHGLALCTPDRALAREALDTIKVAVLAMLGSDDRPPRDCLRRLDAMLGKRRSAALNRKADMRALVEIVERYATRVQHASTSDDRDPWRRGEWSAVIGNEAPLLCRDVRGSMGAAFANLTPAHCAEALRGLLRPHKRGARTVNGVAADLVIACGAWRFTPGQRQELLTAIAGAQRDG